MLQRGLVAAVHRGIMHNWILALIALALLLTLAAAVAVTAVVARQSGRPRVLCLMYHRLARREHYDRITGQERIYTVPVDHFEAQIGFLRDAGFTFVSADQLHGFVTGQFPLPDPSVMITFDDGCRSVFDLGWPVLARHNARATVFVTTDPNSHVFALGRQDDPRATDDELRSADSDILRCESHAVSHRPLRGMADDELRRELAESKATLERILARQVEYLAIPGNWFDARVMSVAREVGYKAVWCSNPGITRAGAPPYGLPRISVPGNMTVADFARTIRPTAIARRMLAAWFRRLPARLLGPRLWLPFRDRVVRLLPGEYVPTSLMVATAALAILLLAGLIVWIAG